jgi:hypothetical protein
VTPDAGSDVDQLVTLRGQRWTVSVQIATSLAVSVVLTVALSLFAWLARR